MSGLDDLRRSVENGTPLDDPKLADLLDAYRLSEPPPVPRCELELEDLALGRRWPIAKLLAAAVLLIGVGIGFALHGNSASQPVPPPAPPTLLLASIPLNAVEPIQPTWPASLAKYDPASAAGVHWYEDLDDARELATYLDLPILVFMDYSSDEMQCPICAGYKRGPFRDAAVRAEASKFVPLQLNFATTQPPLGQIKVKGWPMFHVLDSGGERLMTFPGPPSGRGLAALFSRADTSARKKAEFASLDWKQARALAQRAERGEWLALFKADPDGEFGKVARNRLEQDAQAAVLSKNREQIEKARERLQGTPYADDLERILQHIERFGAFPELE